MKRRAKEPVDYGSALVCNHTVIEVGPRTTPEGAPSQGARNVTQRPIDRYLRRGTITQDQFAAAERIYRCWYFAGRSPKICADYNQKIARGITDAEAREHARREYIGALKALGSVFSSVVIAVVLHGESAKDWALNTNRRVEAGIEYLKDSLDELLRHWGKTN